MKISTFLRDQGLPKLLAPIMGATGFRFSKHYRWGTTLFNRVVYKLVSTPTANIQADNWVASKGVRS